MTIKVSISVLLLLLTGCNIEIPLPERCRG